MTELPSGLWRWSEYLYARNHELDEDAAVLLALLAADEGEAMAG
jgi:hypothetical protein